MRLPSMMDGSSMRVLHYLFPAWLEIIISSLLQHSRKEIPCRKFLLETGLLIHVDISADIFQGCISWEQIIIFHCFILTGVLQIFYTSSRCGQHYSMIIPKFFPGIKKSRPTREVWVAKFILIQNGGTSTRWALVSGSVIYLIRTSMMVQRGLILNLYCQ